jgi:hypothetical protein
MEHSPAQRPVRFALFAACVGLVVFCLLSWLGQRIEWPRFAPGERTPAKSMIVAEPGRPLLAAPEPSLPESVLAER